MRVWGWDTETFPIEDGLPHPRPVCHALVSSEGQAHLSHGPDHLLEILAAKTDIVVAHNAAFDVLVTCTNSWSRGELRTIMDAVADGRLLCTMMAECLLQGERDEFGKTNLAACAERHLGIKVDKGEDTWRLRYGELDGVPFERWPQDAINYVVKDAVVTLSLFEWYRERLQSIADLPAQTQAAVAFGWMREWGMPLDKTQVHTLALETSLAVEKHRAECVVQGILRKNGTADTSVLEREVVAACEAAGIKPQRTPSGKVKRSKDALEALPSLTPALAAHRAYAHASKVLSAYVTPLCKALAHGRVRPWMRTLVATGRTSMSDPPMQQIPRSGGVRECIAAPEGSKLVVADYSGAEIRGLGQAMLDAGLSSPMAEIYQHDPHADIHLNFAASMMGITEDMAKRRYDKGDERMADTRQGAKAGIFGYGGGMSAATFQRAQAAAGKHFTLQQSAELREQYFAEFKVNQFHAWVQRQLKTVGMVRLRVSGRYRRGRFTQCANYCFQGLIADVGKRACWLVVRDCLFGEMRGCKLVHFVHDEIVVEAPDHLTEVAARRVEQIMVAAGKHYMPDVPMVAKPKVMQAWAK